MEKNITLSQKKKLTNIYYLIIFLFVYAFLGWLLETGYALYVTGSFVKRGFLYGPICPIYGWGAIILITFLDKYKDNSLKLFFLSAIVFSIFEYLVSFGMEALFSAKWWDYSLEFFNLNGRISIFFTFVWGIFGILFINNIHPFIKSKVNKLLDKFPYWIKANIVKLVSFVFIIDSIASFIKNF